MISNWPVLLAAIATIYLVVATGLGIPALVTYWQNKDTEARFRAARQFVLSPIWPITVTYLAGTVISSAVRDGIECLNNDRGLSRSERGTCSWCGESYDGEPCAVMSVAGLTVARRRLKNVERERRMKILEDLGYGDV